MGDPTNTEFCLESSDVSESLTKRLVPFQNLHHLFSYERIRHHFGKFINNPKMAQFDLENQKNTKYRQ